MHEKTIGTSIRRAAAGPAMKAASLFAVGIILSARIAPTALLLAVCGGLGIIVLTFLYRRTTSGNVIAAVALLAVGMFAGSVSRMGAVPVMPPPGAHDRAVAVSGRVLSAPVVRYGALRFMLRCRSVRIDDTETVLDGTLPCTVYPEAPGIRESALVTVSGVFRRSMGPVPRTSGGRPDAARHFPFRLVTRFSDHPPVPHTAGSSFARLRDSVAGLIDHHSYGGHGGLLAAMTVGSREGLLPDLRQQFADAGIAHVLAVSGLHTGIVALAVAVLLGLLPLGRRTRTVLIIATLACYAAVCGFRPPVLRAAIMGILIAAAPLFERRNDPENALFAAVLLILAFDPQALFGPSLQLSVAAVWGLIIAVPPLASRLPGIILRNRPARWFAMLGIISVVAFTVTAPISALHFGSVPLAGIPANLVAVPLVMAAVPMGLAAMVFTALGAPLAAPAAACAAMTGMVLTGLVHVAGIASSAPRAPAIPYSIALLVAFAVPAWLFFMSRSAGRPLFRKALAYLPLGILLVMAWHPPASRGYLAALDVGQGDSVLMVDDDGRAFLIDAGQRTDSFDAGATIVAPSIRNLGIRRLDGLFITHTDHDHAGGVQAVLSAIPTDRVFARASISDSLASVLGRPVVGIGTGDSLAFGATGVLVLHPSSVAAPSGQLATENNRSLMLRFTVGGTRVLFTGDLEQLALMGASAWVNALAADVLKVPHHGADELSDTFLSMVGVTNAIISCGRRNRYGHPSPETITILARHGMKVHRTDESGTVILPFDADWTPERHSGGANGR
jgi:competence protein ComEC